VGVEAMGGGTSVGNTAGERTGACSKRAIASRKKILLARVRKRGG
jgi:hypothetical protein